MHSNHQSFAPEGSTEKECLFWQRLLQAAEDRR